LNWAGISEDEFNKKLEACNSEQERATLITETLNSEYKAAADEYNKLTEGTQNARRATSEMEEAQANLGAAIEPVTTAWTNLKAQALEALLPVVEKVVGWLGDLQKWAEENPGKLEIVKAVLIGVAAAVGTLAVALGIHKLIDVVKTSFAALNAVLAANPILIVVAVIAGLVAAFIYLWNNCEGFREFWIGLWEAIKTAAKAVADWFVQAWGDVSTFFTSLWDGISKWFSDVWEGIKGVVSAVVGAITGFFKDLWDGIVNGYNTVIAPWVEIIRRAAKIVYDEIIAPIVKFFKDLWETIKNGVSDAWNAVKNVVKTVSDWVNTNIIAPVKNVFTGLWNTLKNGAISAWNGIKSVFGSVVNFFKDTFTKAWTAVKNVFSVGGKIFDGIKDGIVSAFKTIVNAIIRGINKVVAIPFNAINNVLDKLRGLEILGVSPFAWLGSISVPQIPELATGGVVRRPTAALIGEAGAEAVVPLERNTEWIKKLARAINAEQASTGNVRSRDSGVFDIARAVGIQTAGINSLAGLYQRGSGSTRPIILKVGEREFGRAVVDLGGEEESRVGLSYA